MSLNAKLVCVAAVVLCAFGVARAQVAVGTSFVYQGEIRTAGQVLTTPSDIQFRLFDAQTGGAQIGGTQTLLAYTPDQGRITTSLNFGSTAFGADARWLEIAVRPADNGAYTTLSPRQRLTPVPYSLATRGLTVDANGSLGVGTTAPANRLSVAGIGDNNCIISIDSGATAPQLSSLRYNDRGTGVWSVNKNDSNDFAIREIGPGFDRLYIEQGGQVGIGTNTPTNRLSVGGNADVSGRLGLGTDDPQVRLDMVDGIFHMSSLTGALRMECALVNIGGYPVYMRMFNLSNGEIDYIGYSGSTPLSGLMGITNPAQPGVIRAGFYWNGSAGQVFADVKTFREPNPRRPDTDIVYACVEGPEAAMYARGTARLVNGRAVITLPEHFTDLASEAGMTVHLTAQTLDTFGLGVLRKSLAGIEVGELRNGAGNFEFDWEVKAVRRKHENYQVIRPWDEVLAGGSDVQAAWEGRLEGMARGQ